MEKGIFQLSEINSYFHLIHINKLLFPLYYKITLVDKIMYFFGTKINFLHFSSFLQCKKVPKV